MKNIDNSRSSHDEMLPVNDSRTVNTYLATAFIDKQRTIALVDRKANIVLGLIGIILSLLLTVFQSGMDELGMWIMLVVLPFLVSGWFAFLVIFPRVAKDAPASKSLLFFRQGQEVDVEEFSRDLIRPNEQEIFADYIASIKGLSAILLRKIQYLKYSYITLIIGVLVKVVVDLALFLL